VNVLPAPAETTIQFAHVAYQFATCADARGYTSPYFQTYSPEDTRAQLERADVLVISGFWRNELLEAAPNLKFIQVAGAGYDAFDQDALRARGIRLANSSGVNKNAVSEHAMGLLLSLSRRLYEARDNQARRHWRGMLSDFAQREDELGGKTLLIYGMGAIGERLARLAKAFDMRVVGIKRNTAVTTVADEVVTPAELQTCLASADFVALTCPLTDDTRHVINADALAAMRPDAYVINVARGACVDEEALVAALESGAIKGAALDTTTAEPLAEGSKLWGMPNVVLTPHTAGETCRYELNVLDFLDENLRRLWAGETELVNQVI